MRFFKRDIHQEDNMRWKGFVTRVALILSAFGLLAAPAFAASGDPDTSFGDGGFVGLNILGNDVGYRVAIQADGKIVVAAVENEDQLRQFDVVRFTSTGAADTNFSSDGIASIFSNGSAFDVAIQPDGKIVAAGDTGSGRHRAALARLIDDGSLDDSFSRDGKKTVNGAEAYQSLALQPAGKIVVAGLASTPTATGFAVIRLTSDGSLDRSFASGGKSLVSFGADAVGGTAMGIMPDGRIVIAGYMDINGVRNWAVARLLSNGSLDDSFSGDGRVTLPFTNPSDAWGLAIQSDGKIVVVGSIQGNFGLVRLNTDGSLDTTFSDDGIQTTSFSSNSYAYGVAIRDDGAIMVAGLYFAAGGSHIAVARYLPDGTLDPSFSSDGTMTASYADAEWVRDIALQDDGKFVLSGFLTRSNGDRDVMVARFWQ
jgi:uncharacterized delta-60 repeat protein